LKPNTSNKRVKHIQKGMEGFARIDANMIAFVEWDGQETKRKRAYDLEKPQPVSGPDKALNKSDRIGQYVVVVKGRHRGKMGVIKSLGADQATLIDLRNEDGNPREEQKPLSANLANLACCEEPRPVTRAAQPLAAKVPLDELPAFIENYQRVMHVRLVGDSKPETYVTQVRAKLAARIEEEEKQAKQAERAQPRRQNPMKPKF
jgi:hypothetical protein